MKKVRLSRMLLAIIVVLSAHTGAFSGVPGLNIRTVAHLAPNLDSPDRPAYRPNAMVGIEQNRAVGVGSGAFTPLLETHVFNPSDIISWQNPRHRLEVGFAAVRTSAEIHLSKFSYRIRSSDTSATRPNGSVFFQGTLDGAYSAIRQGIPFGADLIKGTADDPPRILGGPAGNPLQGEIDYLGFGIFYGVASATEAEAVKQYIVDNNLTVTFEYLYDGQKVAERVIRFTPSAPPTPSIAFFTATPPSIHRGESATLHWSAVGSGAVISGVGGVSVSGTLVVAPIATTRYALAVTGTGNPAQAEVTVAVLPPEPPPQSRLTVFARLFANGQALPSDVVRVNNVFSEKTPLELAGEVRNVGTASTVFSGLWQFRLVKPHRGEAGTLNTWDVVKDWQDWVGDGFTTSSAPLPSGTVYSTRYPWKPGASEESVYQFRLVLRLIDGSTFVSAETAAIRVIQGEPNTPQTVVELFGGLSNTPGVYDLQRSTNLAQWTTLTRFDSRRGAPFVVLPEEAFGGPVGFFRFSPVP